MSVIAVDWGSSSFRAYLLDSNDRLIDSCRNNYGVLNLQIPFVEVLKRSCVTWLRDYPVEQILLAGAIGSREGWIETEYAPSSALQNDIRKFSNQVTTDLNCKVEILPGLRGETPYGGVDVMRGEELQLLGLMSQLPTHNSSIVCLPGTHCKWVHIRDGEVLTFASFMTGELFALLLQNSNSIGNLIRTQDFNQEAFIQGVEEQKLLSDQLEYTASLLHRLISLRAKLVTQDLQTTSEYSYLSGLLLAQEIECARSLFNFQQEVILVSDDKLALAYGSALKIYGNTVQIQNSEECFLRGIIKYKNQ